MHKRHKYDIIVILAVLGFGVSLYLAITHYLGITVPCEITRGCEVVLKSKYAILLGLPLSVWGVCYFTLIIFSSLLANHYRVFRKILTAFLGLGALASLVFLSIQFFALKKVCQYCLATDLLTILLFMLDLNIEYKNNENNKISP